jgi:hypothetical protein
MPNAPLQSESAKGLSKSPELSYNHCTKELAHQPDTVTQLSNKDNSSTIPDPNPRTPRKSQDKVESAAASRSHKRSHSEAIGKDLNTPNAASEQPSPRLSSSFRYHQLPRIRARGQSLGFVRAASLALNQAMPSSPRFADSTTQETSSNFGTSHLPRMKSEPVLPVQSSHQGRRQVTPPNPDPAKRPDIWSLNNPPLAPHRRQRQNT